MRRFIFVIIQLILIILLFSFLINYNFIISFEIKDLIYSVSSEYIFIFLLIIFFVVFLFQSLYFKTKYQFTKFLISNKIKKKEKGYMSFIRRSRCNYVLAACGQLKTESLKKKQNIKKEQNEIM